MKHRYIWILACAASVIAGATGCMDRTRTEAGDTGIRKTGFPGMIAAGGGTSGEVLARTQHATDATYAGGHPGMAGGSGGTTGGTATAGTVQETGKGPSSGVTPPGKTTAAGKPDGTGQ